MSRSPKRSETPSGSSVHVGAHIGASAKYEIKRSTIERVPEDVIRAKSGAWLTTLSPFTQWAGLIGDKLAHKRQLLRIQQEEALNAILSHAAPGLESLKGPLKLIPLKFIVPFLENASLEEPESDLVKLWANLLVSSAEDYHADNIYYVRVISQMSSAQARLFQSVIGPGGASSVLRSMEPNYYLGRYFLNESISDAFEKFRGQVRTLKQVWNMLSSKLNIQGIVIEHIDLGHVERADYTSGLPHYSIYQDKRQNDYAILRGLGLLDYVDTGYFVMDAWKIKVMAHYVTSLGLAFAESCGARDESPAQTTVRTARKHR
jgi:hypothetical protein